MSQWSAPPSRVFRGNSRLGGPWLGPCGEGRGFASTRGREPERRLGVCDPKARGGTSAARGRSYPATAMGATSWHRPPGPDFRGAPPPQDSLDRLVEVVPPDQTLSRSRLRPSIVRPWPPSAVRPC